MASEIKITSKHLTLQDIMTSPVVTVESDCSTHNALTLMRTKKISALVVQKNRKPIGIFTEQDALFISHLHNSFHDLPIGKVMTENLICAPADLDYREGYHLISEQEVRHLIVTNHMNNLLGIISESDFLNHLGNQFMVRFKEVGALMSTQSVVASADLTLSDAIPIMIKERTSQIIVTQHSKPIGVFTERDLIGLEASNKDYEKILLAEVMSSPVITVDVQMSLPSAIEIMHANNVRRLVVINSEGELQGHLSHHDIVKRLYDRHVEHLHKQIITNEKRIEQLAQQLQMERTFRHSVKELSKQDPQLNLSYWHYNCNTQQLVVSQGLYDMLELTSLANSLTSYQLSDLHQNVTNQEQNAIQRTLDALIQGQEEHATLQFNIKSKQGYDKSIYEKIDIVEVNKERLLIGNLLDTTYNKEREQQLIQYAVAFENLGEAVMITNEDHCILAVNPAFTKITGYNQEEVLGEKAKILKSGKHKRAFYEKMHRALTEDGEWRGEIWNRRKNDEIYPEWLTISKITNQQNITHYIAVFSDISKIKSTEQELLFLAHHDPLTDLPNRILLQERLESALKRAKRNQSKIAVLFVDLDRFKEINDHYGHPVGDLLLKKVASRIQHTIREEDTVARISGDEFVILLENIQTADYVEKIADKLLQKLAKPIKNEDYHLNITVSIGIALSPENGVDTQKLLKNADSALYLSKKLGRNKFEFYSDQFNTSNLKEIQIRQALSNAIKQQEFELFFQPVVNLSNSQTNSLEALIRWKNSSFGNLSPTQFIPIAEEAGIIIQIGEWVIDQACLQMRHLLKHQTQVQYISVNLSAKQLADKSLVQKILSIIEKHQLQPEHLEFEITESVAMHDKQFFEILRQLKKLGFRLAIDDFGTGYSSLHRLKQVPFDKLKIDSSFVQGVLANEDDTIITKSIISLAKSFNKEVVAEGVETQTQLDFLQSETCYLIQGFWFSKPLNSMQLHEWLKKPFN